MEVPHDKSPDIRIGGNPFLSRYTGAVSCARLDADQHRRIAHLSGLDSSRIFEAMPRNHAIVRIGRRDERRWVLGVVLDIMIWRIGEQRLKFVRVVGRTVVIGPEPAGRKLVEAQHIHNTNCWQRNTEKIWPLIHNGTNQ